MYQIGLPQAQQMAQEDAGFTILYARANAYNDKEKHKYFLDVDGGIADNMGLRAMTDAQLHQC